MINGFYWLSLFNNNSLELYKKKLLPKSQVHIFVHILGTILTSERNASLYLSALKDITKILSKIYIQFVILMFFSKNNV